jgi:hypothetical protein
LGGLNPLSKIISYETLARQQHLNFLRHRSREYQEREDYLARSRKLLFKIEGQMRQTEIQQLETFRRLAEHFHMPLAFPDLGDRLGLQEFFATNPFLVALQAFLAGRLTAEDCYRKILELKGEPEPSAPD